MFTRHPSGVSHSRISKLYIYLFFSHFIVSVTYRNILIDICLCYNIIITELILHSLVNSAVS